VSPEAKNHCCPSARACANSAFKIGISLAEPRSQVPQLTVTTCASDWLLTM